MEEDVEEEEVEGEREEEVEGGASKGKGKRKAAHWAAVQPLLFMLFWGEAGLHCLIIVLDDCVYVCGLQNNAIVHSDSD